MTAPSTDVPTAYLTLRADAEHVLEGWHAPDPQQERLRVELLDHCAAHPDALWKQGPPAHLTASALVLNASLDKVLLTLHAKAGLWLQFGGHFEPGDQSVLGAATREAREESGIADLVLHPQLVHLDLRYAGVARDEDAYAVSEESLDVAWWPVDALPDASAGEIGPLAQAARRVLAA